MNPMCKLRGRRWKYGIVSVIVAVVCGCGSEKVPLPQTYPVHGRVLLKGGGALTAGVVQFQSLTDPRLQTTGEIANDGSFELTTHLNEKKLAGAIVGAHQVTVIPPMPADQSAEPIVVSKPYTVEAKDNFFTIEIDKPRR